jgi:two-component system sensor histidine kinase/response regulator
MPTRLLSLLPRYFWYPIGIITIGCSHLALLTPYASAELLPVVVTALCVMCTQRHVIGLSSVAVVSAVSLGLWQLSHQLPSNTIWPVAVANATLGAARLVFVRSPHGPLRLRQRLSRRLRRQSEQLQAAIESQESNRRTVQQFEADRRSLLEHLPLHLVQKDLNGRFTFVSKSFCDFVGRPLNDILGKSDADLFSADSARKFAEDDRRVMSTGQIFNDVESTQLPTGEMSFMQVRKTPLIGSDGKIAGVQGIFWDVTEEFSRRKALQRIESMAHALIHAALDAVLIADDEGRVLEANPASQTILGFSPGSVSAHPLLGTIMQPTVEEVAGRSSDPVGSPMRYQRKTPINDMLKSATGRRIEARLRRSTDDWFEAEISAHPLDVDGHQNWAIFIRDITKRKRAEHELRAAKESAEHANATKSEFVANVSHELRTPLTGIIGLHELLANSQVDERQRHYLDLAKVSAGNLLTLIDDLLDFSKIEAGHIDIDATEFSIIECVEEAALALTARAQLRGLELLLDFQPGLPQRFIGDPHRIKQILLNLVGNAIKFTDKGDIRIRVHQLDPPAIEPTHLKEPDATSTALSTTRGEPSPASVTRVRFEVHDTGIGIPTKQREMIFEAFRQADSSTTRRYGGTGLGLTICRDLIAKMNGSIGIEDSRRMSGQVVPGSCFYFELSLPALPDSPQSLAELADNPQSYHVVLAASDCPWRDLLYRELQQFPFPTTPITSAQLAARQPANLFSAGNKTIVVADYRELCSLTWSAAPVVYKWVLLNALIHAQPTTLPTWLTHAHIAWIARPVCRQSLVQALTLTPSVDTSATAPVAFPRRSADLLLVEDSLISQTVLKDMLQSLGHRVSIASNGREAIDACQSKLFDLVLMDIQMPDMDGLEATQAIRQHEQGSSRRQCIYALTAHATSRDRQQCEAASMDGFLVKPISRDRLSEAIDLVLGNYSDGTSDRPASLTAKPTTELQFDEGNNLEDKSQPPARLDAELTLATADASDPRRISVEQAFANAPHWEQLVELMHGNENLLRDVLSLLVREAPRLGRSFQMGLKDGNLNETRRAVHTLKSNVRYVGLKEIGHYAQWLEHLARDQQSELLHDHAENLCSLADAVADWAEQQLKSH